MPDESPHIFPALCHAKLRVNRRGGISKIRVAVRQKLRCPMCPFKHELCERHQKVDGFVDGVEREWRWRIKSMRREGRGDERRASISARSAGVSDGEGSTRTAEAKSVGDRREGCQCDHHSLRRRNDDGQRLKTVDTK
jgi:hypothetical protein